MGFVQVSFVTYFGLTVAFGMVRRNGEVFDFIDGVHTTEELAY